MGSLDLATISAVLSSSCGIYYRPKDRKELADTARKRFYGPGVGDHISLLKIYNQWEESFYSLQFCFDNFIQVKTMRLIKDIKQQIIKLMEKLDIVVFSCKKKYYKIHKCMIEGFFYNVAHCNKNGIYHTIKNHTNVYIHPSSSLLNVYV